MIMKNKSKFRCKKLLSILLAAVCSIVLLIFAALYCYLEIFPYHAGNTVNAYAEVYTDVRIEESDSNVIKISPVHDMDTAVGIVFYPGARVEYTAYIPLLAGIAKEGYTCYLIRMPFNLATLGSEKALRIIGSDPDISSWYISGHSAGGLAAMTFAEKHAELIDGFIEISARPKRDLSSLDLKALVICGSLDLLDMQDEVDELHDRFPKDTEYLKIEGANHAQFGDYGKQQFDKDAEISAEEQRKIADDRICEWLRK